MHAFERWKELGRKQQRRKRQMVVDEIQDLNLQVEAEVAEVTAKVRTTEVRSIQKGHQNTKKIFLNLYHKNLRGRLQQWYHAVKEREGKSDIIEKTIIKKMQWRILKMAFAHYREKVKLVKRLTFDEIKSE